MDKDNKNKQQSSPGHSFYKEAKKSMMGDRGFSKEKTFKTVKKLLKWSVYAYLIIASLWGCVNQFRVSTSQNVSQGIEFYKTYDEVNTNLYQATSSYTYSSNGTKEVVGETAVLNEEGEVDNIDDLVTVEALNELQFYTINTTYNLNWNQEEYATPEDDPGYDPVFLESAADANKTYGTQASLLDYYGTLPELIQADWDLMQNQITTANYWSIPNITLPTQLRDDNVDDNYVNYTTTWGDFLTLNNTEDKTLNRITPGFEQFDPITGEFGWIWLTELDENDNEILTVDDNNNWVTSNGKGFLSLQLDQTDIAQSFDTEQEAITFLQSNLIAIPYVGQGSSDSLDPSIPYASLTEDAEKMEYIASEIKFGINNYLFTNPANVDGTTKNFFDIVIPDNDPDNPDLTFRELGWETLILDPEFDASATNKTLWDATYSQYSFEFLPYGLYEEGINVTPDSTVTSNGEQYVLIPQQTGFPIALSDPQKDLTISERQYAFDSATDIFTQAGDEEVYASWTDLPVNHAQQSFDTRTSNAGWSVLDLNGDLIELTDPNYDPEAYSTVRETEYLSGLTKTTNKGYITNSDLATPGKEEASWYVLDEKQKNLIEEGYQVSYDSTLSITGYEAKSIEFEQTSDFKGLQSPWESGNYITQGGYVAPSKQTGWLAPSIYIDYNNQDVPVNVAGSEVTSAERIFLYTDVGGEWYSGNYPPNNETDPETYWRLTVPGNGVSDFYGLDPTVENYSAGSNTTRAIQDSGQSGNNAGRVIFASWSDWGRAWNPNFGPMHGTFVFPLAMVSTTVAGWMPYSTFGAWGVLLGVFLIVFTLRALASLLSYKSGNNQAKMQEVQSQVAEINAKYAKYDKKNKQMKSKKQQETMALYKKHEINPLASFGTIFVTLPIFLSMWIIISALPVYKIASVGIFSFAVSPFYGMFNIGQMFLLYLLVGITVGMAQGISSKLPTWLADKRKGIVRLDDATKAARKKSNKTQNIMVGVFIFIGLTVPTLLGFYWIVSAIFTCSLEISRHAYKIHKAKKVAT